MEMIEIYYKLLPFSANSDINVYFRMQDSSIKSIPVSITRFPTLLTKEQLKKCAPATYVSFRWAAWQEFKNKWGLSKEMNL